MSFIGNTSAPRQKRAQVVRACDSCRQHRIKCDNHIPCVNCKNKGQQCSNAAIKSITLPHAYREIERLKQKVRDLEKELEQERNKPAVQVEPRAPSSRLTLDRPSHLTGEGAYNEPPQRIWEGIQIRTSRSTSETWYGASSLFFFIGRISSFLTSKFQQAHSADEMLSVNSPNTLLDGPSTASSSHSSGIQISHRTRDEGLISLTEGEYLSPMQEEYFLNLYWQSIHTSVFPILNEAEFMKYYRSLWTTSGNSRKASPLVDIVLAICMQFGLATSRQPNVAGNDADSTVGGRWYYLRCLKLLAYEFENPTIATLQTQILCSVYLCCGTFQNTSDSAASRAVRTAHMLGHHLDPPDTMSQAEREMIRRLWWSLYVLDTKIGMKYGRPFLLQLSNASPKLPDHRLEAARQSGSSFAPLGDGLTWLSFHIEHMKLFIAVRAAHTAFYGQELNLHPGESMRDSLQALDSQATVLNSAMTEVNRWADSVPSILQVKRRNGSPAFSMEESVIDIEQFAPLWLQRQRILLELMYHNLCINLYRPLICFGPSPPSLLAEQAAGSCALHAMAFTNIAHQVLSSTTLLTGWHEAFQWQWNAAMTLVGYVLAYPQGSTTPAARKSISTSVEVLDNFGESFGVALNAANTIRNLTAKVDILLQQSQGLHTSFGENRSDPSMIAAYDRVSQVAGGTDLTRPPDGNIGFEDANNAALQDVFNMAFDVDQWTELNMLWPSTGDIMWEG